MSTVAMIYLWRIPNNYPESLIGEYDKECSPDRFLFVQDKQIGNGNAVPSFKFTGDPDVLRKYDVLPNSTMIPLVSERVARILTCACRNDIELLTASVHVGGETLSGFNLVNVLPRVASVDHGGSSCIFIPGTKQIMKFNRLAVKSDALGTHHLAREQEFNSFILVSETLKQVFDSERVTGHAFVLPDKIKP
jgi:hypothetical protein